MCVCERESLRVCGAELHKNTRARANTHTRTHTHTHHTHTHTRTHTHTHTQALSHTHTLTSSISCSHPRPLRSPLQNATTYSTPTTSSPHLLRERERETRCQLTPIDRVGRPIDRVGRPIDRVGRDNLQTTYNLQPQHAHHHQPTPIDRDRYVVTLM